MRDKVPLVSIICPTYNHEAYIRESLDGFVMQRTNFPFEIIVHDDASTDSTAEIVKEYEVKYTHLFNNIYQAENQYSKEVMSVTKILLNAASGKYIACCEGDDYWTDPYKLQKQVDFLERNDGYSSIFHNVEQRWEMIEQSSLYLRDKIFQRGFQVKMDQLIGQNIVPTCSLLFKKESLYKSINIIPWNQLDYGDWPIVMILGHNGSVYYQPMISAVRRMNLNSVWGLQDQKNNIYKTFRTRKILKNSGIIEEKYTVKMEEYEFQLFLQLYNIKDFWVFRLAKKSLGKIKRALDKYSLQYLVFINTKKFKRVISIK
jgi:glycosyltransferase involved in cell wall biosynthesis